MRMLTYPESLVAHHTGILHPLQCADILDKMFDSCNGLSHLGALEFANAADNAAKQLYGADYRKRNVRPVATCAR